MRDEWEEWVAGWAKEWVNGWVEVLGSRDGFININDMYNNDVSMGGVRVYETYEVK